MYDPGCCNVGYTSTSHLIVTIIVLFLVVWVLASNTAYYYKFWQNRTTLITSDNANWLFWLNLILTIGVAFILIWSIILLVRASSGPQLTAPGPPRIYSPYPPVTTYPIPIYPQPALYASGAAPAAAAAASSAAAAGNAANAAQAAAVQSAASSAVAQRSAAAAATVPTVAALPANIYAPPVVYMGNPAAGTGRGGFAGQTGTYS